MVSFLPDFLLNPYMNFPPLWIHHAWSNTSGPFDHSNIWWGVRTVKLAITQVSPFTFYFSLLGPNISLCTLFLFTTSFYFFLHTREHVGIHRKTLSRIEVCVTQFCKWQTLVFRIWNRFVIPAFCPFLYLINKTILYRGQDWAPSFLRWEGKARPWGWD